jgi:hypothetical protein
MADKKISALTASTTPLAGTEVLPIVQSGSTVKVAVSDLTAGRIVSSIGSNITGVGSKVTFDTTGLPASNWINTTSNFNLSLYAGRGSTVQVDLTTDYVDSYVGGVRQSRLGTTGLTLDTGNLIIGTSGKGIDFSATSGSGTSELLADYEEGTWSPVVVSTAGSITSYTASGTYTKIGRVVELNLDITITNNGTGSGQLDVSNLPFATKGAYCAAGSFAERGAVGFGGYLYAITTAQVFLASSIGAYPGGTGYRIVGSISYPT